MDFRLELDIKKSTTLINYRDKIMLCGSCFTENIGSKLDYHKFKTLQNPNGILFNPISIAKSVTSYIENKQYNEDELFYFNDIWQSWEHHSRFSSVNKNESLQMINDSQKAAHQFLKEANWLMLTLGSAFVYELTSPLTPLLEERGVRGEVVANCHKVPTDKFNKRLLGVEEVMSVLDNLMHRLFLFNPKLKIIFTISPVRHLRDGFVENNRSKSTLIQAVHQLVDKFDKLFYFPAYELVIDDLRDYRFYAEDMVHPNYAATNYVWEKFVDAMMDEETISLMDKVNEIQRARNHKPFNPTSDQHKKFLQSYLHKTTELQQKYPQLDLQEEIAFFNSVI
ncbi:MAG: GSCFA domain-containing protein [Sphingobacteriales bacterium]|nr:GSCFA domain-containing protein [Sphingobacteriales bacterium]